MKIKTEKNTQSQNNMQRTTMRCNVNNRTELIVKKCL